MPKGPILILSGTNRPGANALRLAKLVEKHYAATDTPVEIYSLADMPREIFDPSSYATKPASWLPVQDKVLACRGLHIVTPEYNGGFPGVLKYFIDMLKFPESFEAKPVAFTGEAAGTWGGMRPIEQLAQIFAYRNAHIFPLRVFIPGIGQKLDAAGSLTDAAIDAMLAKQASGFAAFTAKFI